MNFRALAGNALTAFAAQGVSLLASLVMSLLVPKVLGIAEYGYWQLFVFYASYSGFFLLGLNDGVYLVEGGKPRNKINKRSINSQFFVGACTQLAIGACIAVFAVVMVPDRERAFVLLAFALYVVMFNVSGYLGYVFQAMNETKLFSYMLMLERGAFLVPLIAFVVLRISCFEAYVGVYLVARACSLVYCCWHARDILSSGFLAPLPAIRESISSIKVGFGLMLANVASMLVMGVARGLVDFAWGVEAFGLVSFSLSIVTFFVTFVSQASMVLFPALRQGTEFEQRSIYRGIRDMTEVAFPAIYLLYFPAACLLSMWLPQYSEGMRYLAILLPLCAFETKMSVCCATYLKVLRKERVLLRVNLATVAFSSLFSVFGVYVVRSLDAVLAGVVACVVCRSLWSERYLDRRLGVDSSWMPVEEVALTVAFVVLALFAPALTAVAGYAVLYFIYLFANRAVARSLIASLRRVLRI